MSPTMYVWCFQWHHLLSSIIRRTPFCFILIGCHVNQLDFLLLARCYLFYSFSLSSVVKWCSFFTDGGLHHTVKRFFKTTTTLDKILTSLLRPLLCPRRSSFQDWPNNLSRLLLGYRIACHLTHTLAAMGPGNPSGNIHWTASDEPSGPERDSARLARLLPLCWMGKSLGTRKQIKASIFFIKFLGIIWIVVFNGRRLW